MKRGELDDAGAEPEVTVRLAPAIYKGLMMWARREGELDLPEAVEAIVRAAVMPLVSETERLQMQAEAELMAFVDRTATAWREAGTWTEHATANMFRQIKSDCLDTYSIAVGGEPLAFGNREKGRINKRIGARVKRRLGATVAVFDGKREKGQPSRAENALILSYTLFVPPTRPQNTTSVHPEITPNEGW